MHEISNYSILSLEISCMELSGFGRMKCAETCMKHACFRRSILSRVVVVNSVHTYCLQLSLLRAMFCGTAPLQLNKYI